MVIVVARGVVINSWATVMDDNGWWWCGINNSPYIVAWMIWWLRRKKIVYVYVVRKKRGILTSLRPPPGETWGWEGLTILLMLRSENGEKEVLSEHWRDGEGVTRKREVQSQQCKLDERRNKGKYEGGREDWHEVKIMKPRGSQGEEGQLRHTLS